MAIRRNTATVDSMASDFRKLDSAVHAWGDVAGFGLGLSQLRGFWPMGSVDENGAVYDLSAQGRTLTNNSSTPFGVDRLVPYADFDGSADYLSRAHEAGLGITGALTMGCWTRFDTTASAIENVMGKRAASGNLAYYMRRTAAGLAEVVVSSNGTATTVATGGTLTAGIWYFLALRYVPSTELSVFVDDVEVVNTTSIPASINNAAAAPFAIGANGTPGEYMHGRATLAFLCATNLSDVVIERLHDMSRPLFFGA